MVDGGDGKADARARKAAANRAAYAAERAAKDRVLLRLDRGAAAKLDEARSASGLSRSAFLMRRFDALMSPRDSQEQPRDVGNEFDRLFGGEA